VRFHFSVDCFGAQGDHNPVWKTDNPLLGDETGAIVADSGSGVSALLSNYSARFQLFLVTPEVNGTYSCVSQRSGLNLTVLSLPQVSIYI